MSSLETYFGDSVGTHAVGLIQLRRSNSANASASSVRRQTLGTSIISRKSSEKTRSQNHCGNAVTDRLQLAPYKLAALPP